MGTPLRTFFPDFSRDPVFSKIRGNGALRRPGRRPPPARQARLCRTYGRAAADAARSRAREKRATNRATDLQLLHPRARGTVCAAFLPRKDPICVADVGVQGPPAQQKRVKNSRVCDTLEFRAPPGAPAGLEPVHRGVFQNTHLRGLQGDIPRGHGSLCKLSAHTAQRHHYFAH